MVLDGPFAPGVASRTSGDPFARPLARHAATWQRIEQVLLSARDLNGKGSPQMEQRRVVLSGAEHVAATVRASSVTAPTARALRARPRAAMPTTRL